MMAVIADAAAPTFTVRTSDLFKRSDVTLLDWDDMLKASFPYQNRTWIRCTHAERGRLRFWIARSTSILKVMLVGENTDCEASVHKMSERNTLICLSSDHVKKLILDDGQYILKSLYMS